MVLVLVLGLGLGLLALGESYDCRQTVRWSTMLRFWIARLEIYKERKQGGLWTMQVYHLYFVQ